MFFFYAFKAVSFLFFFPDLLFDVDISHNIYTSQCIFWWRTLQKLPALRVIFDRNCQIHLQPDSCSEQTSGFNLRCLHWSTEKRKIKKKKTRTIFSCPSRLTCQRCSRLRHWVTWCILLLSVEGRHLDGLHSDSHLAEIFLLLFPTLPLTLS